MMQSRVIAFFCFGWMSFVSGFLLTPNLSHHIRWSNSLALTAKRRSFKQKIKRWGDDGNDYWSGGSGFGSRGSSNALNHDSVGKDKRKTQDSFAAASKSSVGARRSKASSEFERDWNSKTTLPKLRLAAAEYARLNTKRVMQQAEEEPRIQFTREYLEQQVSSNKPRQIAQISENPLLFVIDEFVDPEACRKVDSQANGCFNLFFPEAVSDQLFQGQASELDGLLFNAASSGEHEKYASCHPNYPDGLHMDSNNQCLFRHVTCLLYLNDVPEECGGATLFPIARALPQDPALKAAQTLLEHSMSHTQTREIAALGLEAEAQLLEDRIGTNFVERPHSDTAIRIQPKAGRLLVFFSRCANGREDPRTWHAGERLRPGADGSLTEKRILTLFKEVDYEGKLPREDACTLEDFLAPLVSIQRDWLKAKAHLQRALLSQLKETLED